MTPEQALLEASKATHEAIHAFALTRRTLEATRNDRLASDGAVFDAAQAFRKAEADLYAAVETEAAAILAVEEGV